MTKHFIFIVILALLGACAAPKRGISQEDITNQRAKYVVNYQKELRQITNKTAARLRQEYDSQSGQAQSFDVLVLSGGGERGAFGAGFLKGWGKVKDAGFKRPDFDSVTGISAGALIAPFAFVGSEQAYQDIVNIYQNPDDDLVRKRMLLAFLAGSDPYFDTTKLHQRIRDSISDKYVTQMAEHAKKNKVLIVGATNLDYGVIRAWDLAALASNPKISEAKDAITTRLIASSAIPGAFAPVDIDQYLYVDGGASMQMLSGIDDIAWLRNGHTHFDYVTKDRPLKIRIWLIINNKLELNPQLISPKWTAITERSIRSLLHSSILQSIQGVETFADLASQRQELEVEMRFVAIPQDVEIDLSKGFFDRETMQRLVEIGERMGTDPNSWQRKAPRPEAAIIDVVEPQ
jgi:hypothetical protein